MKFTFSVDGTPVELSREPFAGRLTLTTDKEVRTLQSPWDLLTHFSLTTQRRWECSINGHAVVVEKQRPWLFAGFRPQTYRVYIDGKLIEERTGF